MKRLTGQISILLLMLSAAQVAKAESVNLDRDIGFDQQPGGKLPLDVMLRNEDGDNVRLAEFFGDKPVILMPVYYRCPMLCGLELNGLLRCLRAMRLSAGQDFEVVTYSIDPREGPELAREKRDHFVAEYNRPVAAHGWHFLTGDEESLQQLNDAIGFRARYDSETGQYAHAAGLVVCTSGGRIAQYLFGVEFEPRDLRLSVIEASQDQIGSVADQVLLYCYLYDPTRGKYGLAILRIIRVAGVTTALALAGGILWMLRRDRRQLAPHTD